MAVLRTSVNVLHTFVNIYIDIEVYITFHNNYYEMYTITSKSISIKSVSNVTAAGIGADVVETVMVTCVEALSTLINVCGNLPIKARPIIDLC